MRLFDSVGELIGLLCFHVDDVLVAGAGPEYEASFDLIQKLYDWGLWESKDFVQCGTRFRQKKSGEIFLDQSEYVRSIETLANDRCYGEDPE